MEGMYEVLVIIGMFFVRLGLPVVIFIVIGYLLRRLDSRWEEEAKAQPETIRRLQAARAQRPCWEEKGCSEEAMARCAAYKHADIPCWLARLRAERRLPTECSNCARYTHKPAPQEPAPQTVRA
jgi:hypothetical protein